MCFGALVGVSLDSAGCCEPKSGPSATAAGPAEAGTRTAAVYICIYDNARVCIRRMEMIGWGRHKRKVAFCPSVLQRGGPQSSSLRSVFMLLVFLIMPFI